MSITDELRKWIKSLYTPNSAELKLKGIAIADRIDAEHERLMRERKGCIHYDPERHYCDVHDLTIDESMAEHGWVRLPKDADGEVWHPNDMMEAWGAVECMVLYPNGDWYLKGHDMSAPCLCASECRHHHEPTVEDVLREFAERVCNSGHQWGLDADETIADYAKRLRLAGEGE